MLRRQFAGCSQATVSLFGIHRFFEDALVEATIEMTCRVGLQGSGSARLVHAASQFDCDILLVCNERTANAKNVMEVMRLPARAGAKVMIQAVGRDDAAAVKVIAALLSARLIHTNA
ncbi:HPr family phosphocarrier protein [Ralstonia sp. GX3-BWBA]|uniref:HPr family phosphocarrier protein n=1 Tax=Ralstonia sp. GX3-BWBA TaxID=2219865 RepID=UPI001EF8B61C|nr:HPr family phosphocarrier protein [Ralstonia sp. GX3-BWBA]